MADDTVFCELNKQQIKLKNARQGFTIRPSIFKLIQEVEPNFSTESWISNEDLKKFKLKYIEKFVEEEEGKKDEIQKFVANAVANHDFLSTNYLNSTSDDDEKRSFNDFMADKIAEFGGSWSFIAMFTLFVLIWCCFNTYYLKNSGFDPYPYIFLNLILGCIASLQAPFIMMSQNRALDKDRKRALNDFKVNLKSEFEIMIVREKLDHVINIQNPHIRETLEMHTETLEEIKQFLKEFRILAPK